MQPVPEAILSVIEGSATPVTLDLLRRHLSHVSYISLRFHLARLLEEGAIVVAGGKYTRTRAQHFPV